MVDSARPCDTWAQPPAAAAGFLLWLDGRAFGAGIAAKSAAAFVSAGLMSVVCASGFTSIFESFRAGCSVAGSALRFTVVFPKKEKINWDWDMPDVW
jgi:hypothetical protein